MTTTTTTASATATDNRRREIRAVYYGLMVVMGLGALDQSIVATALPRIVGDLGGLAHLSWVVTAYVLASTSTMPLYGKLSDQYGRKPLLYTAILTFLAGSALCGMAQNLTQLIIFRAIQGMGAGGFLPLSQIIIGDLVPPEQRGRRQGGVAAVFAATSVVGPMLGGLITDLLSWRWNFYLNLPLGVVAFYMIARALPHSPQPRAHKIDYLGSALMTGAITSFLLVLALGGTEWPWDAPQLRGTLVLASVLAVLLLFHVRRVPEPVLPPQLFQSRIFNIASIVMALTFTGLLGATVFFPLLFQLVMGVSPAHSGLLTVPLMIGLVLSSTLNGRFLMKSGRYKRTLVGGLALAAAAFALLAWGIASGRGYGVIEPCIFALGMGLGLVMPNMTIAVQNALPLKQRGIGTAMLTFFRSLGGLVGVTGSGAILAQQLHGRAATAVLYRHAIGHIFSAGAVLVGLGLLLLCWLPEQTPEPQHTKE